MRILAAFIAGVIFVGLILGSMGFRSFDGPYLDPPCRGEVVCAPTLPPSTRPTY